MESRRSFTGHSRRRKTSRFVQFGEIASRLLITIGGIGTIIAVTGVCVFLVWVMFPLFLPASIKEDRSIPHTESDVQPLRVGMDENQELAWSLFSDGSLAVFRLDNARVLERKSLFGGKEPKAISSAGRGEEIAFGFADGSIQLGRIGFASQYLQPNDAPPEGRNLQPGESIDFNGGLLSRTPQGQLRAEKIKVELEETIKPEEPGAILLIDLSMNGTDPTFSVFTSTGKLRTTSVTTSDNLLLGIKEKEIARGELVFDPREKPPEHLLLSGSGDNVYLVWDNGQLLRINTQVLDNPTIAEEVDLLGQEGLKVTALQFLIGKSTLLVGDSSGRVRAWFRTKPEDAKASDGIVLRPAHEMSGPKVPVTALAASSRTRMMAAGYEDGRVRLYYVTSEKSLGEVATQPGKPVRGLTLAPKDDGMMAESAAGYWLWSVDPRHPEVTLSSLFLPVWYEGYEEPHQVWQSSSGSDEFEPKFGMWPLVFGTMKATFYSLLLGVPLALMAAVYTSEFLQPRMRSVVKPTIEMMASLPSVVLGFLSALVLAPFVEHVLPVILAGLLTVPCAFLFGAYIWQLLPEKLGLRLTRWRFFCIVLMLPAGLVAAVLFGPWIERIFFQGDLKQWLAGQGGNTTFGWMFLLLPLSALLTAVMLGQWANPQFRRITGSWGRTSSAVADLVKAAGAALVAVGMAYLMGALLNGLGLDPRKSLLGTYVQRNALVVGFMMGFAIIPIIYTIAEDALSAVPEHLRSASLGCGATQWQTAHRIIIPTAMSGLFSAVMVGLGRAVGETMIVLMAAGNTPLLEMNIFNGFRTLSANIAVELPEAVRDSTHYRTLFLAALVLFAMTFALNTIAEAIRQRFRKRAYQL
jgi:phosphate transport system permease protein